MWKSILVTFWVLKIESSSTLLVVKEESWDICKGNDFYLICEGKHFLPFC